MTSRTLIATAIGALSAFAIEASAKQPAPLIPTALVEDVTSATADVEFMDYVGTGQTIKLEPRDILVLSYLKSCTHETITGGTVAIGPEHSEVQGGKVTRKKIACNGGNMKLSVQQANASGGSAFRLQTASFEPMIYALAPIIQIPRMRAGESRTLVIERVNRPSERFQVEIGESHVNGGFYDMAKANKSLNRGAVYTATLGNSKVTFKVYSKAKSGKAPVVSRLLQFPPS